METVSASRSSLPSGRLSSITFAVAVLLFLLPFVEIKCNGEKFATNTGLGLAFGSDYKTTGQAKSLENMMNIETEQNDQLTTTKKTERQEGKMYVGALIALLLGITGLIVSFVKKDHGKITAALGVLAALALLIVMVQLQSDIKGETKSKEEAVFNQNVDVSAVFTAWYWLAVVSFLISAYLGYRLFKAAEGRDRVPKNAPQLNIENPGDQSDFPRAPSESELG
ncbi:MAG: hypothetical protein ACXWB9_01625 [Flavisolibacter sp.]